MHIVVTGGTGLVGKHLTTFLAKQNNYHITILTRNIPISNLQLPNISFSYWNVEKKIIDADVLKTANAIVHLAGAGVMDKSWTPAYKQEIINSRTKSIELIYETLASIQHQNPFIISASAIGWYGADTTPIKPFIETDVCAAQTFLGNVCLQWENAALEGEKLGLQVSIVRLGIVLANDGGAFKEMTKTTKQHMLVVAGTGKQMYSWVHIDDVVNAIYWLLQKPQQNIYNLTATEPASYENIISTIQQNTPTKTWKVHAPAFILKLILGERSIELLKSTTVSNQKLYNTAFIFSYNTIHEAVKNLLKQ